MVSDRIVLGKVFKGDPHGQVSLVYVDRGGSSRVPSRADVILFSTHVGAKTSLTDDRERAGSRAMHGHSAIFFLLVSSAA